MNSPTSGSGHRPRLSVGMAIYSLIVLVVVGLAVSQSFIRAGQSPGIRDKATFIAPAGSGGGWDTFMRVAQESARKNDIGTNIQVLNVPGAAGTIGLKRLAGMEDRADVVMVGGTGQIAGVVDTNSSIDLDDVTPIARVIEEVDVVLVPADSPYETLDDLMVAWAADPSSIPFTGGGSFDRLVMVQLALEGGIKPADVIYIPKSGGGEVAQALVTKTAAAATSGYPDVIDQIESGRIRALGLVSAEPIDGVDIPTLRSLGYDVTLSNWRAVFGAPDITDEEVIEIRDMFKEISETPQWETAVDNFKWSPVWLDGPELEAFIEKEQTLIRALYKELRQ